MFSERLRFLREEKGITQQELGNHIDLTKANISKYENGKLEPSIDMLNRIAEFFGVSSDYLVGRSNIKAPKPTTAVINRPKGNDENFPPEVQKELDDYIEFLKNKYKK